VEEIFRSGIVLTTVFCARTAMHSVSPGDLLNSTGRLCSMNDDIDQPMAIREQVNDLCQVKLASTVQG